MSNHTLHFLAEEHLQLTCYFPSQTADEDGVFQTVHKLDETCACEFDEPCSPSPHQNVERGTRTFPIYPREHQMH